MRRDTRGNGRNSTVFRPRLQHILPQARVLENTPALVFRANQFSNLRSTGILPVAEKHGQDARATANVVTQLE